MTTNYSKTFSPKMNEHTYREPTGAVSCDETAEAVCGVTLQSLLQNASTSHAERSPRIIGERWNQSVGGRNFAMEGGARKAREGSRRFLCDATSGVLPTHAVRDQGTRPADGHPFHTVGGTSYTSPHMFLREKHASLRECYPRLTPATAQKRSGTRRARPSNLIRG